MTKEQRLKKRHNAEKRFRFYGLASIFFALLFVIILVQNIFSKGSSAFMKTAIKVEVFFDKDLIEVEPGASQEEILESDFFDITIETLLKAYPAKNLDEENELIDLFSTDAEIEIRKAFLENNNLVGKKINLEITASDDIDQLHKGNYPRDLPEDRRRISNFQLNIYDNLVKSKKIVKNSNQKHNSFRLIGGNFMLTFAIVATQLKWLNKIKYACNVNEDRKDTRSWHYINLPDSEQNTYKAKCPENGCLIAAFHEQMNILNNRSATFLLRAEALWFIGHFIGDVHQPMHVGYPEDRGGNDHKLKFSNGTSTNMHSLWDGEIIEHMESLHGAEFLENNVSQKVKKFLNKSHSQEFEVWAQESRDLAMQPSVGYRNNELKVVTNAYMESHFEIVQERIALGAIRLSQILNRMHAGSN